MFDAVIIESVGFYLDWNTQIPNFLVVCKAFHDVITNNNMYYAVRFVNQPQQIHRLLEMKKLQTIHLPSLTEYIDTLSMRQRSQKIAQFLQNINQFQYFYECEERATDILLTKMPLQLKIMKSYHSFNKNKNGDQNLSYVTPPVIKSNFSYLWQNYQENPTPEMRTKLLSILLCTTSYIPLKTNFIQPSSMDIDLILACIVNTPDLVHELPAEYKKKTVVWITAAQSSVDPYTRYKIISEMPKNLLAEFQIMRSIVTYQTFQFWELNTICIIAKEYPDFLLSIKNDLIQHMNNSIISRSSIFSSSSFTTLLPNIPQHIANDKELIYAFIKIDPSIYGFLPDTCLFDTEIALFALHCSKDKDIFNTIPHTVKRDPNFCIRALKYAREYIMDLIYIQDPKSFMSKEFCYQFLINTSQIVSLYSEDYVNFLRENIPEDFRNDYGFVEEIVKHNGLFLASTTQYDILNDRNLAYQAVQSETSIFQFLPAELQMDSQIIHQAFKLNSNQLRHIKFDLEKHEDVTKAILLAQPYIFEDLPSNLRLNENIRKFVLENCPHTPNVMTPP